MAKDFRSDRVRTNSIIGSGSITGANSALGLVIYSGSKASDFKGGLVGGSSALYSNVGPDVWLLIDGTPNTTVDPRLKAAGSTVLFKGDVVVSGTLWSERSVVEVDDTVAGDFKAPNKLVAGHSTGTPENYKTGFARLLVDPTTPTGGSNRTGTISFNTVQGSAGVFSFPTATKKDVFFHVSGSRGVRGTNNRGIALFEGDVFVSGNMSFATASVLSVPGVFSIGGDLTVGGGDIILGTDVDGADRTIVFGHNTLKSIIGIDDDQDVFAINTAGAFEADNDLEIDASGNLKIKGDIEIGGDTILKSGGGSMIQMNASDVTVFNKFVVQNDLKVQGGNIINAADANAITLGSSVGPTIFAHDIRVGGKDIQGADGVAAMHLSGSGNVTFNENVTVVGNLNVSGSTVSIGVENLNVQDPVILMGSGSTSLNSNGGIAIASGSSLTNQALTFGRGSENNRWRAGRKDVAEGTASPATTVSDSVPVPIEAAAFVIENPLSSNDFFVTGSKDGAGSPSFHHVTASNPGGSILIQASTANTARLTVGAIRGIAVRNNSVECGVPSGLFIKSVLTPDGNPDPSYLDGGGTSQLAVGAANTLRIANLNGVMFQSTGMDGRLLLGSRSTGNFGPVQMMNIIDGRATAASKNWDDENRGLFLSGSERITLTATLNHNHGLSTINSTMLELSASSDDATGGSVIILSASGEYNGGSRTKKSGFIAIGAQRAEVDSLFTMSKLRDVRTLIKGTTGTRGSNTRGVSLIDGDLVVSGNTNFIGATDIGTLSTDNLTLASAASGEPFLRFRDSSVQIRRNAGNHLEFADAQAPSSPYTLTQLAALSVADNSDVFAVTHQNGSSPFLSYIATTGSFSFDHKPTLDGYTARRTNQIGSDVFFFVSGAVDSRSETGLGTIVRGVSVFGGDMVVSGAIKIANPGTAASIPMQIGAASGTGIAALGITGSVQLKDPGASRVDIDATNGSLVLKSEGVAALTMASSVGVTSNLNLKMENNNTLILKSANRTVHGFTEGGVEKLKIKNTESNGVIIMQPGSGNGHLAMSGSILPGTDRTHDLGSPDMRWANLYTGDLHLRNERGNWTIYEEPDMLVVVNNLTGKKYKMGLTPLEDTE